VLRGARTRMARKPPALARELLRNFPKRRGRGKRRRRRGADGFVAEAAGDGFVDPSVNGGGPKEGEHVVDDDGQAVALD
jgi:ribonuclease E